jgi:electron transfer flavoprotein beta subunit
MNVIILMKQTPDTAKLSDRVTGLDIMQEGGPRIVNPWDEYSLEEGISLAEKHKGNATILTLGKPESTEAMKTGLAMGAKEAILLSDPAFADGDSLATARTLKAAIEKIGDYDLVVAGKAAIDGDTAQTPAQVAALLDVPYLGFVAEIKAIDFNAKTITVVRAMEYGRETVESRLPAVISVLKEANEPRYPSFMGIRKAARAKIPTWGLGDLGLDANDVGSNGSQVAWVDVSLPPKKDVELELIEGEPKAAAKILADRLMAEKVI